jgi:broad specificity phosphatase PhoE
MPNQASPSSRLILVRHGETVGNSSIRYYGKSDLALSDLGRTQMRAAARWLRTKFGELHLAPVFSSPLQRATESARLIAGPNTSLIEIAEFVEVDFGLFEGLTADEIAHQHPDEFIRWNRDRLAPDYTYPAGENRADFAVRVNHGTERMLSMLDASPRFFHALLVAHRGVIRTITQRLAGVAPEIAIASIQVLRSDSANGRWNAEMADVVEHL